MAIDRKYGRVTTEHGDIGADEPVVVFRAKDRLLPQLLDAYYDACSLEGSPQFHLDAIDAAQEAVRDWQRQNPDQVRTPASDGYRVRTEAAEQPATGDSAAYHTEAERHPQAATG